MQWGDGMRGNEICVEVTSGTGSLYIKVIADVLYGGFSLFAIVTFSSVLYRSIVFFVDFGFFSVLQCVYVCCFQCYAPQMNFPRDNKVI